ncbi:hypothetical protein GCM10022392_33170 [Mucilaginibacter panaciglaebae]|uniref:Uncharacterized protein n=1 Tax=Mucilaginibacter panaciglaebae TaxID=502331 RepID=A0ABP7X550_9SPHI
MGNKYNTWHNSPNSTSSDYQAAMDAYMQNHVGATETDASIFALDSEFHGLVNIYRADRSANPPVFTILNGNNNRDTPSVGTVGCN